MVEHPIQRSSSTTKRSSWKAIFALFVVTLIWGWTFVWMKQGMRAAEAQLGPAANGATAALFLALRFGLAAAVLWIAVPSARRGLTREVWKGGFILGGLLFVGFALQMLGLAGVSPAVSAFLTSLYVLFTALILAVRERRRPSAALCIGVLLATIGTGFIRGRPELSFNASELATVACAFVFAVHILATDRVTRRVAPMPATFATFAWVTVLSSALLAIEVARAEALPPRALLDLSCSADFLTPLVLSSILATVIALSLMNLYQRDLDPVRAAILYALEPIWAALAGIAVGFDAWDRHLWLGGALLFGGNIIAEFFQARAEREFETA
jgi:drug/metabolite transporter (DMT)-like permease